MNKFNKFWLVLVILVVLIGGAFFAFRGNDASLGGASGTDFFNQTYFRAGFVQGGGVSATSTTATATILLPALFDQETTVAVTPNGASLAITLPASSTLSSFLPYPGDTRTIMIRNATTTAAVNITFAGGTGTILKTATSTNAIVGDTDGSSFALLTFVRKADTNLVALLQIFGD